MDLKGLMINYFNGKIFKDMTPIDKREAYKRRIAKWLNTMTFLLTSRDELDKIAGKDELICVMGDKCYYTGEFLKLSEHEQICCFIRDFMYMTEYFTAKRPSSPVWALAGYKEVVELTPDWTVSSKFYWLAPVYTKYDLPIEASKLPDFKKYRMVQYLKDEYKKAETTKEKLALLDKCMEIFDDYWGLYNDSMMDEFISYMPKITPEKVKTYLHEIIENNNKLLGEVIEVHLEYDDCILLDLAINKNLPYEKKENPYIYKLVLYDKRTRLLVNSKTKRYQKWRKGVETVVNLKSI